ncbi:hypothetical protein C8Q72DRAFT_940889 [Fomitopsis betulina]|nr:hypothetical protein C8Q72DRAFT_940889 [Fomitopsis betulina]
MSSHLLNADALRALKRPAVQKIAKRERIRAIGKTADIIKALLRAHPDGVEPLERVEEPVRQAKEVDVNDETAGAENVAAEGNAAPGPSVFGDSISQHLPAAPKRQASPATQDKVAGQLSRSVTPPLPPPAATSAARSPMPRSTPQPDDEPVASSSSSPKSGRLGESPTGEGTEAFFAQRPKPQLPFAITPSAQGSSSLVSNRSSQQLREQVHLSGASTSAAADDNDYSRNLMGASYSQYDFVKLLEERNIQLDPVGTAQLEPRPVDPREGPVSGTGQPSAESPPAPLPVDDDLPPSSPPRSSPTPEPRSPPAPRPVPLPAFTLPSLGARATEDAGPSRRPPPTLPVGPPMCSSSSPPPALPTVGPLRLPAQPSAPFRFGARGVRLSSPSSPTSSEGSTDTGSPIPAHATIPAPFWSRRQTQRGQASARLNADLHPGGQAAPRLRPARFSPPAARRPLQREATVFIQPVNPPEAGSPKPPAQAPRRPLRREDTVVLKPPVFAVDPLQAEPSRRRPQAQIRDPADPRFFMPLPPAEAGPSRRNRPVISLPRQKTLSPPRAGPSRSRGAVGQRRQQPTADSQPKDRIIEVAESLRTSPPVQRATHPAPDEQDEEEYDPLSLDISSSDSAEADVEEGGDDGDGNDAQASSDDADRDGEVSTDDTGNAGEVDKGKGRAADDGDDDAGDFWAVNGGFSQRSQRTVIEVDPSNLEDTVDAMLKVLEERARSRPTVAIPDMYDPPRHRGCSREELQRMLTSAVSQAEKMKMIKLMRQQMYYDIEYLRAQAEYIHTLELVMHSKRISLEELLQMLEKALKAKRAAQRHSHRDGGDVDGGDDSGAGTSGGDGASSGGSDDSRTGNGPADQGSDEDRERDAAGGHGNSELAASGTAGGRQTTSHAKDGASDEEAAHYSQGRSVKPDQPRRSRPPCPGRRRGAGKFQSRLRLIAVSGLPIGLHSTTTSASRPSHLATQAVRRDEGEGTGVARWLAYRFAPPTNHLPVPQCRAGAFHRAFASGDGTRKFDGSVRLEQLSRASDTRGKTVFHLCCLILQRMPNAQRPQPVSS